MSRLRFVLCLLPLTALFAIPAQACQCSEYDTPVCAAFWRADTVFVGRLAAIKPLRKKPDKDFSYVSLHFVVEESFRGVSTVAIDIATQTRSSCAMEFHQGKRYLIYASLEGPYKQLVAEACSRTRGIGDAAEDLTYLRKLTREGDSESISGQIVREAILQGIDGIKVEVEGNGKKFETVTDNTGAFKVPVSETGKFKVRAKFPYEAFAIQYAGDPELKREYGNGSTTLEYEVELQKNWCDYRQLTIYRLKP